ncbi:PREDICTED: protein CURVATURE THYLAKOID 1D, chloroplastic-like [Nelumbo nucifera]|uniref:Protein CURVATURE THYLAKOID 1D, chloroplastic-like n=1 Tax=Nelumbo nucifera TaxID=4432 RepID=A0A1U8AFJ9_NELNU|nr:PREDICTED: protein CURVATURE THYLAKOID 1D, chloroplastic-like [Nelumbo nucifera]
MELYTSRAILNLPPHKFYRSSASLLLSTTTSLPLKKTIISYKKPGLHYFATPLLRATASEEAPTSVNEQLKEAPDGVTIVEETPPVLANEQNAPNEAAMGEQLQPLEFLDKLDIKLDLEDTYSILLYGGSALVAVWLASAIVGAIDSIPLFPKVMEVVGLAYTIWFTTRYLIFKKSRDELAAKIKDVKQQVLGPTDD